MTATPIPRTLVLTYFGDMDVSSLREKPPGRQPIETRALPLDRLDEVIERLGRAIARARAPIGSARSSPKAKSWTSRLPRRASRRCKRFSATRSGCYTAR